MAPLQCYTYSCRVHKIFYCPCVILKFRLSFYACVSCVLNWIISPLKTGIWRYSMHFFLLLLVLKMPFIYRCWITCLVQFIFILTPSHNFKKSIYKFEKLAFGWLLTLSFKMALFKDISAETNFQIIGTNRKP